VGEKGLARAHDISLVAPAHSATRLVAPTHVAQQGRTRQRPRGAGPGRSASVARLSRHPYWRDRG